METVVQADRGEDRGDDVAGEAEPGRVHNRQDGVDGGNVSSLRPFANQVHVVVDIFNGTVLSVLPKFRLNFLPSRGLLVRRHLLLDFFFSLLTICTLYSTFSLGSIFLGLFAIFR